MLEKLEEPFLSLEASQTNKNKFWMKSARNHQIQFLPQLHLYVNTL
jgi:hypothetical protein